jgi:predicted amidohydrolase
MRIAVIHFSKGFDIDENEQSLLELNIQAAQSGADLIVNPELSIAPCSFAASPLRRSSQARDVAQSRMFAWWFATERGPRFIERLRAEVVAPYHIYAVAGTIRSVPGYAILHNSAFMLGPDGFEYTYDKRLLTSSDVLFATQGISPLLPAHTAIGNIGVMICGDYSVPLISRSLVLNGSDIIVVPAAITAATTDTLKVRALENGIPFALANCYDHDDDWPGPIESVIVAADGAVLDHSHDRVSTILWKDIDFSDRHTQHLRAEKQRDRRPKLYQGALMDLTAPLLRPPTDAPTTTEIWAITVSGTAVDGYMTSPQVHDAIAAASEQHIPVALVLPQLELAQGGLQEHILFARDKQIYLACGYIENNIPMLSLYAPSGEELIKRRLIHLAAEKSEHRQIDERIEHYIDLPAGRVGLLAGVDLLYPEVLEVYRNAGVDLVLVPAGLGFDGSTLFDDIAKYRHIHLAVADRQHNGGIYTRFPEAHSANTADINDITFDLPSGRSRTANIPLTGLEVIVSID